MKASFKSFGNERRTLGNAIPSNYFRAKADEGDTNWWMYPQALVKQLEPDKSLLYGEYDIAAKFNADFPFYFAVN